MFVERATTSAKRRKSFVYSFLFPFFFSLDLLSLKTVLEVVEVGSFTVPLAEDDHSGFVVSVVGGHVGVEELPVVEGADDLLDEVLSLRLEVLDVFLGLAELLHLVNEVLEVALDVAHVGLLLEGGFGEGVVVDDINDLLDLALGAFAGGAFLGVLVDVGGDTEVFVADDDVAALNDEHAVFFLELNTRVAEDFSFAEVALENLHDEWGV